MKSLREPWVCAGFSRSSWDATGSFLWVHWALHSPFPRGFIPELFTQAAQHWRLLISKRSCRCKAAENFKNLHPLCKLEELMFGVAWLCCGKEIVPEIGLVLFSKVMKNNFLWWYLTTFFYFKYRHKEFSVIICLQDQILKITQNSYFSYYTTF